MKYYMIETFFPYPDYDKEWHVQGTKRFKTFEEAKEFVDNSSMSIRLIECEDLYISHNADDLQKIADRVKNRS